VTPREPRPRAGGRPSWKVRVVAPFPTEEVADPSGSENVLAELLALTSPRAWADGARVSCRGAQQTRVREFNRPWCTGPHKMSISATPGDLKIPCLFKTVKLPTHIAHREDAVR
jgi:hypothetical protein